MPYPKYRLSIRLTGNKTNSIVQNQTSALEPEIIGTQNVSGDKNV